MCIRDRLRTLRPALSPSADDVPCRCRPGWPTDWRREDGSHVHHRPVDGIGAQLFPCRLVHGYPAARHRGPRRPTASRLSLPDVGSRSALPSRPSTRFPAGPDFLRGFHHWFLHTYTSPSCWPSPSCLVVPVRPGVVEAAPALPLVSEVRLPPASAACCDRPQVGLFLPPGHVAPRGAPTHNKLQELPRGARRRRSPPARTRAGRRC